MKSWTVISRYNLVTHSFFARSNYCARSGLTPISQGAKSQDVWPALRQEESVEAATQGPCGAGAIAHHPSSALRSKPLVPPWTPLVREGPEQQAGHNRKGKEPWESGKQERLKPEQSIFSLLELQAWFPRTGWMLQVRIRAVSRHDGVHIMLITYEKDNVIYARQPQVSQKRLTKNLFSVISKIFQVKSECLT